MKYYETMQKLVDNLLAEVYTFEKCAQINLDERSKNISGSRQRIVIVYCEEHSEICQGIRPGEDVIGMPIFGFAFFHTY